MLLKAGYYTLRRDLGLRPRYDILLPALIRYVGFGKSTNHTYIIIIFIFNVICKYINILIRFGASCREGPRDREVTSLSLKPHESANKMRERPCIWQNDYRYSKLLLFLLHENRSITRSQAGRPWL